MTTTLALAIAIIMLTASGMLGSLMAATFLVS